jgi:hypothetical protein
VYVEPYQPIYPTPFLDETQVVYVNFLWHLDNWVFAIGSNEDYIKMRDELRLRFNSEPCVGDVIRGLMNDSMAKSCRDQWERDDLKKLMDEFRKFEGKCGSKTNAPR